MHPVTAASAMPFDDRTMTPTEPTEPVESRVKKWYSPSLLAQALYRSYALFLHKCISTHFGSNQRLLQMILWIVSSCPCQSMTNLTRYNARKRIFAHFLGNKCKDRLSNHSTKAYPESWGLPPSTLACWGTTLIRGAVATIAESAHMMVNLIDGYMA